MKLFLILSVIASSAFAEFKSEDSATVNLTGGNADLKTYNFSSKNSYKKDKSEVKLTGAYNYGESNDVRSAENWNVGLRYDYSFNDKMSAFLGEIVEADRFAGIERRYNTDLGLKYIFTKTDRTNFFAELGYRYTKEESTDASIKDRDDQKARAYAEISRKFKDYLTGKYWIEYIPNFSESDDFLINMEPSLIVTLSKVFSLKSAYLWKYDNEPTPGNGKHDYNYTLSLIANF
jgi:putative salt-induced outer membrane protein